MHISYEVRRHESTWLTGVLCLLVSCMAALARDPTHWIGVVGCALGAGLLVMALWQRDALQIHEVLGLAIAFRLAFLPLLPVLSDDAYRYVWDGMVQMEGINPYRYRPDAPELSALHNTYIFERLNSATYYSVYPPVSQWVFAVGGAFYDAGWHVSYFIIKGLFASMEVGGVFILASMVSARNVMLYAWHPLTALESAGQGHTEAAVVLFGMVALRSVRHGQGGLAALSIAAATWTKLVPVVLLPLLWRRFGWRPFAHAAVLSVIVWLPYMSWETIQHVASSLSLYVQFFEFNAGVYYAVKEGLALVTGADWSKTLGPAFGLAFMGSALSTYLLDARYDWSFAGSAVCVLALFFVFTTTVHPWYFLTLLPFAVTVSPPVWAIWWLALCAIATYLFYVDGPYWSTVAVGWGGAALLLATYRADDLLQQLMLYRARQKVERLRSGFEILLEKDDDAHILDLGAGEGYVGAVLQDSGRGRVLLADVVDMNRTSLPHITVNDRSLPFDKDAFDVTVLNFVLHHARDPRRVLSEALRVSRRGVIVVESTVSGPVQHKALRIVDQLANRLRSQGKMSRQEDHLHFRPPEGWIKEARSVGATVVEQKRISGLLHPKLVLTVQ